MSQHPSRFHKVLLAAVALSSTALAACVAEAPARPGVDYGYVAGTYSTAPTPYAAAPYGDPYNSDPYYDSYYGYNSPFYGGAYYGNGYYYGPSTTYVYTRDHYYPGYGYRSRGNNYRDDRRPSSGDHSGDRDHGSGDHNWRDHGGDDGHHGDNAHQGSGNGGNWNHDRPGRPDGRPAPGNASPHQDDHPRPVMGGGARPGLAGGVLSGGNRAERPAPARAPAKPDARRPSRERN